MRRHELKTWPAPFDAVSAGLKHHEVRKNDRDFQVGDTLVLLAWSPVTCEYTGGRLEVRVTYITEGGTFGLHHDICVMSIARFASTPGEP